MKIDDFRRGVVRVCDGEGASRGTGFFVSPTGHVLTCDHVVQGAPNLSVTLDDGRNVPATLAPELSLPELDFAVLNTNIAPDLVLPVEFAGAVGDPVWASGFQMQGQVKDALPTMGKIAGQTGLEYSFGDRLYKLPEILRLENAIVEPGISGGCAALQQEMVAIGAVNAMLKDKGGFILPFRAIKDQTCGLYQLLQQNRQTVARYGKYLNQLALTELCNNSARWTLAHLETSGRYSSTLYVDRDAVSSVVDRFMRGSSSILPIVGQTGTGKTSCVAYLTQNLKEEFATVLLLAYRLSPQREGLAATVAANLNHANPDLPVLSGDDLKRALAGSSNSELIVILDGLNELPGTIKAAREWLESTWEWLRKNRSIRLIVTSRPEYWNSAQDLFADDLLYTERPAASHDEQQKAAQAAEHSFQLGDFTQGEAEEASLRYGFPMNEGSNIFRHPLFYNIARKAVAGGTTALSTDRLFHDYIEAAVKEICVAREQPNAFIIRSVLDRLATTVRINKSLWIDRTQFLDASSADTSIAEALMGEHMLVEGQGGVRFAFDETAHYLVAQVVAKEFEKKTAEEIDWIRFRKDDPIGADSMSFFVAALEGRGKTDSVARILNALAAHSHPDDEVEAYYQHTLFLRLLQWLRYPSDYFPAMLVFAESCTSQPDRLGRHSLTELFDLPGIPATQQMQLLAIMAKQENDRRNRWKDWQNLSESEFWNEGTSRLGITTFRLALRKVLERDPDIAIAAVVEWVKDRTKIASYSPPAEATVSDVACGILYHSADHWLEPIVDGLARMPEVNNAGSLLFKIVRKLPVEMLDVCERWVRSGELSATLPIRTAGILLEMGPTPALTARLVAILDTMLEQADSPDIQAAIADSFSLHPSTAPRALDLTEQLMQRNFPVNPWLLRRLISLNPDRVFGLLDSIIVHSTDLDRRQWAVSALEELAQLPGRALKLLSVVDSYLAHYPELGHRLGLVVEKLFYSTKLGTPEGDAVDAWVRTNFAKIPSNTRLPIIFGVLARAEKDPSGMPLLRAVIAAETPDDNLGKFLDLLPRSRLPMPTRLELVTPIAQKFDEIDPRYQGMLSAVTISMDEGFGRFLAEQVAQDPTPWASTVVEFSTRVHSGERPFDAAHEIMMRELNNNRPRAS